MVRRGERRGVRVRGSSRGGGGVSLVQEEG